MKLSKKLLLAGLSFIIMLAAIWLLQDKVGAPGNKYKTSKPSGHLAATTYDKTKYSLTNPDSIWVVINKQRPLKPVNYAPADLVGVGSGQYLRKEAATAFMTMFSAAQKDNIYISAASGYRSYQTQVAVYDKEFKTYGKAVADSESARPGYSEHQSGFAIDVAGGGCSIADCFANTRAGQWMVTNSYKYGFILRYTSDKTSVTGYRYEPWHFRYIGVDLAVEMHKQSIKTLEEFFGLPSAPDYN